jgi:hypothetical protein
MDSYIVRVYRRGTDETGEEVAGMVEEVGTDQRRAFQSLSGLMTTVKQVVSKSDVESADVYDFLHPAENVVADK